MSEVANVHLLNDNERSQQSVVRRRWLQRVFAMRHSATEKTGSCATTQDLPVTGSQTSDNCVNNNIKMKTTKLVENDSVEQQHQETQGKRA